jgi:GNAT superfamily N-acetyltransferase
MFSGAGTLISQMLEEAITISSRQGIAKFLRPILKRMPPFIFETKCSEWTIRQLQGHTLTIKPDIQVTLTFSDFNETFRWIESLNVPELFDEKDKKIAVAKGHWWVNAKYEGNIIGCMKICFNRVYIPDYQKTLRLPENVAYITDVYILPDFRNKKMGHYLVDRGCDLLKKKGFTKQIGFTENWNIAAKHFTSKIKRTQRKRFRYLKIFGFGFFTSNPANF